MKPRCCLCGRDIGANEHFFVARFGKTLCRECGIKTRGRVRANEVCISSTATGNHGESTD